MLWKMEKRSSKGSVVTERGVKALGNRPFAGLSCGEVTIRSDD